MHGCTQFFYSGTGIIQWFLKGIQVLNLRRSSIMHACYCMLNYDYKCCNMSMIRGIIASDTPENLI